MRKKRILSTEHKEKIALALLGRKKKFSDKALENIRIAASNRKGIKRGPRTEEVKQKISNATKGIKKNIIKPNTAWFKRGHIPGNGFKKGNIPWNTGRKMPLEIIEKMAASKRGGHITEEHKKILSDMNKKRWANIERKNGRRSKKNREWAKLIYERDNYKCTKCGKTEKLHAHHIISWRSDETKRYDLENGITLCSSCHMSVEKKGKRKLSISNE